jgi:hypothetical protein
VICLNADGSRDFSYRGDSDTELLTASHLAIQSDGSIVVGGSAGFQKARLQKLSTEGKLDPSFKSPREFGSLITLLASAPGEALFLGVLTPYQFPGIARPINFVRLLADGSVDTKFKPLKDSFVRTVGSSSDGCIIAGTSSLYLLKSDGTISHQLPIKTGETRAMVIQPDQNILIAGAFTEVNSVPRHSVARLYGNDQQPIVPLFGPFLSSHGFEIAVPTVTNRIYHLEYGERLETPQWKPLYRVQGDGNWLTVADPVTNAPRRFYRVRVE